MSEQNVAETPQLTRLQQIEQSLVQELGENDSSAEEVKGEEAAPAEESESETETEESATEEDNEVEQEDKPKKSKNGLQKRMHKLTSKISELERQLEEAKTNKSSETKPEVYTKPETDSKAPSPDDFETYAEYNRALVRYEAKQIHEEEKRKESEQRMDAELAKAGKKFEESLKEVAKAHDDFDEVFDPDLAVNGAMQAVMLDSEIGAEIAYYLCKNPEEAAEIASMHPIQSARRMALIEAKLSKSAETPEQSKKVSKAPAPVNTTAGTSSSSTRDPNKMSPDEFNAWYLKKYGRR